MRTIRSAVLICFAAIWLACAALAQDSQAPQVLSVTVAPALVAGGDNVSVTAIVTDNIGVVSVTANGVGLTNVSGDSWEGSIPADNAIGVHGVSVTAEDGAGNPATDTSGSYKTGPVYGIQNDDVLEPVVRYTPATSNNLYRVWGAAHVLTPNSFTVSDGGSYPVTVLAAGHDVCDGDFVIARGILDSSAFPATLSHPRYSIAFAAPRTPINISDTSIGKDLMAARSGTLMNPAPAGNLQVRITSQDVSKLLVAEGPTEDGKESIFVQVNAGSTNLPQFYVHCLADSGTATLLVTAPGCQGKTVTITCRPSGFIINSPTYINTTSFAGNSDVYITSARLNPTTLAWESNQPLRPGVTAQVNVSSSAPGVGTIAGSPVTFNGGDGSKTVGFDPAGAGQTTVSISPPAGFSTPSNYQSIQATVTAPDITMSAVTVGKDLQIETGVYLQSAPPAPVDVTVTSSDPSKFTLSKSLGVDGSASVTFYGVTSTYAGGVYVQGRALGSGLTMTASAPGYNTKQVAVTVDPSGFIIDSPASISTTTFATNSNVYITSARLNPTTLAWASNQRLRPGVTAQVNVSSSAPGVGTIAGSPVTFNGGDGSKTVGFDPVGAGQTTVSISPPAGFSTPSNYQSIQATVTAPDITMSAVTVGKDLQIETGVYLQSAPPAPVDVTVTSSDPSKFTLSKSLGVDGSASVTFYGVTSTYAGGVYVQGRALGSGLTMTASAPGYNTKQVAVTVDPSGFIIDSPTLISATTFSANSNVYITSARLNPTTLAWASNQRLRPGVTAQVNVSSSAPGVGTIAGSPVTFNGGDGSKTVAFDPVGVGQTTVSIDTPAGFSIPSNYQSFIATILMPKIFLNNVAVGRDLQMSVQVSFEVAPPASLDLTVTSSDPGSALLSKTSTVAGTGSITFEDTTSGGYVYVQGLELGQVLLTATAPGYTDAVATASIDPSGFIINSPLSITTTAAAGNSNIEITPARLNPTTLNWSSNQAVRAGASFNVGVTSSNPSVGLITQSPLLFSGANSSRTTQFDPVAAGVSTISVVQPPGFSEPSNYRQITATVNP